MPARGKIYAEIELRLDKLREGVSKSLSIFRGMGNRAVDLSQKDAKKMSVAWQAGFALISVYAFRASRLVRRAFGELTKTFATYEQSLANTQSVAQANTEELERMDEAARRVGATTRSTASEAANALYFLASAGFSAAESIAALDGVNALAIATQSELARTSETVAVTIRQYNLETSEATRIANTFTAAITNSLATMNKLTKAFEYVGPIAAGLGFSVEETTGALQVLFNKGFTGEKAGRGLRTILVNLADSTSVVNRKIQELGITFDLVNPVANTLAEIFDNLRQGGVDATNAASIFGKVSGVQLASLIANASDAEGGIIELTDAITGTNRAFEAMEIQMDTLQGSFDQFKNATEALEIQTGEGLEPILRSLVDTATEIIRTFAKLPSEILGTAAALFTVAGIVAGLGVGFAALNVLLGSMGISLTLLLGPIGVIIGGLLALTGVIGGTIIAIDKIEEVRLTNLKEEFSELAEETEVAKENMDDFVEAVDNFKRHVVLILEGPIEDAETLGKLIQGWADAYNLTYDQILRLIKADKAFSTLNAQVIHDLEEEIRLEKEKINVQVAAGEALTEIEIDHLNRLKAIRVALGLTADEEEKRQRNIREALSGLKVAFQRATEFQKLLGDQFDRNKFLLDAYHKSQKIMIEQGLKVESDEVQSLILLWDELQAVTENVFAEPTDTQKRIAASKAIENQFKIIAENEKIAIAFGQEYNAELELSNFILNKFGELLDDNFTLAGVGMQKLIKLWGKYIIPVEKANKLVETYQKKLEQLTFTEEELSQAARDRANIEAKGNEEALIAIKEYFDEVDRGIVQTKADKRAEMLDDWNNKIKALTASEEELVEIQRTASLKAVKGYKDAEDAVDEYYDALADKAKLQDIINNFKEVTDIVMQLADVINNAIQVSIDRLIEIEERALDEFIRIHELELQSALDAIDLREEAALIAAGVLEQTERERLQEAIDDAIATGDAIAQKEAEDALTRFDIQQTYQDERNQLEKDMAEERLARETKIANKIAQLKYQADIAAWVNDVLNSHVMAALATLQALTVGGPVAAAIVGIISGAAVTIVTANPPLPPPEFANSGIVPGSSFRGDQTKVMANAGELILDKGKQENIARKLSDNNDNKIIHIHNHTYLDGKEIAISSAKYYNNGKVKLT
jgi:TP901 family phage tail tape measure protein